MMAWEPVNFIALADGLEIHVDEIAMTIGRGDTALATHAWPEDGNEYAICHQVPDGGVIRATPSPVGASVPLWSDERILSLIKEVAHNDIPDMRTQSVTTFRVEQIMMRMRNDYEAHRGASVPSEEVLDAIGYCWRWAQTWSEKGGADSDERYAFMNKQVDIVVAWLQQQRGQG